MIRQSGKIEGIAVVLAGGILVDAAAGIAGVVDEIVANIQVEITVGVEIGEDGRSRPVAVAIQPRLPGYVVEAAFPRVAIECIGPPAGDEEVGPAVVVVIADGDSVAVTAGKRRNTGAFGDVFESTVSPVSE